ncbi:STAS domain-containing protein [Streptomyces sp. NPDC016309]|uniref:STAS domain-containing protein n=1 Tax=Streptomyces sp. NPDC016309 TaxID=3364965 RepID=UPI0037003396
MAVVCFPVDTSDPKVFRVTGRIGPADVPRLCGELAALLAEGEAVGEEPGGRDVVCDAGGIVRPDLTTLDALARLSLTARRLGHRMTVSGARPDLRALCRLAGLDALLLTPPAGPEDRTGGTSARCPGRSPSPRPSRPRPPGR